MIILVKVNQSFKIGSNPKFAAQKSWGCSKLLDKPELRNQFKYLVAYYKGEIVGTFCIKGIAHDTTAVSKIRNVAFLLTETDELCDHKLKNCVNHLIENNSQKILKAISYCYLDEDYINQYGTIFEKIDCKCGNDGIPVVDINNIEINDHNHSNEGFSDALPTNLWLRINANRNTFESFRNPHSIDTITNITYHPNGKITFNKSNNSSGELKVVKKRLDRNEMNLVKHIFTTFHQDPKKAIEKIKLCLITNHVAHYNGFSIEFEAFTDKEMTKRVQYAEWNGNVLFVNHGFLQIISEIMF